MEFRPIALVNSELSKDTMFSYQLLRYGKFLKDIQYENIDGDDIRYRLIEYCGELYLHKMVNELVVSVEILAR